MNIVEFFEKYEDEYLNYRKDPDISNVTHDFYVMNALSSYVESPMDLIISSTNEEICFSVDPEFVYESLSEGEMIQLIRCGLRYSGEYECFCMFV